MKKIWILLLLPLLLVTLTACSGAGKTIVLKDDNLGFKTTFKYKEKDNFSDVTENDEGASKAIAFKNEELDVEFEMYYNTMRSATYKDSQKTRSAQKYYKEYKFGDYEAYAYGNYDSGVYLNILLATEENDMVDVLFVSLDRIDNNTDVIVYDILEKKTLQNFFNSIKFEKTK